MAELNWQSNGFMRFIARHFRKYPTMVEFTKSPVGLDITIVDSDDGNLASVRVYAHQSEPEWERALSGFSNRELRHAYWCLLDRIRTEGRTIAHFDCLRMLREVLISRGMTIQQIPPYILEGVIAGRSC